MRSPISSGDNPRLYQDTTRRTVTRKPGGHGRKRHSIKNGFGGSGWIAHLTAIRVNALHCINVVPNIGIACHITGCPDRVFAQPFSVKRTRLDDHHINAVRCKFNLYGFGQAFNGELRGRIDAQAIYRQFASH